MEEEEEETGWEHHGSQRVGRGEGMVESEGENGGGIEADDGRSGRRSDGERGG